MNPTRRTPPLPTRPSHPASDPAPDRVPVRAAARPRPRALATTTATAAVGVLGAVLLLGGCGAGSDSGAVSETSYSSDSAGSTAGDVERPSTEGPAAADAAAGSAQDTAGSPASASLSATSRARAVISTGTVELSTPDVAAAVAAVQRVVDRVGGQVGERSSETDDVDGEATELVRARLVLRVPAARFAETVAALEETEPGVELISSESTSSDVTTQVIDVEARVGVARRSIDRVAVLLDRAESIADVVSVEAQLAQREAELASLVQQQTWLADQSSLSTLTVSVRQPREETPPEPDEARGFVAGLAGGWDALAGATVVVATVLGAALPWLVLALALGVPGVALTRRLARVLARRSQRRTPAAGPVEGPVGGASA